MGADTLLLVTGAAIAGLVQGVSGFAFSMVAMSIWAFGLEPRVAAVMAVFGGMTGQWLSALTLRRGLHFDRLWPFLAGGAIGVPLGVWLVPQVSPRIFLSVLGSVLVVCCPVMMLSRLPRLHHGGRAADALAGAGGGVMAALAGFAGVLPTLWTTLRGWDKDTQRAVVQNFNLVMLTATMATYVASGTVTPDMLPMFALVAPALVIPSLLGTRVYLGLSEARFRQIVLSLLTAAGSSHAVEGDGRISIGRWPGRSARFVVRTLHAPQCAPPVRPCRCTNVASTSSAITRSTPTARMWSSEWKPASSSRCTTSAPMPLDFSSTPRSSAEKFMTMSK